MSRKIEGIKIDNGENCQGMLYLSEDDKVEMSTFDIKERYPAQPRSWSMNVRSLGMAVITRGSGVFRQKNEPSIPFEAGDVIEITPGEKYAYEGDFGMVTTWSPPFEKDQYTEEVEE